VSGGSAIDRATRIGEIHRRAKRIRERILRMAAIQGQGYVGQGLGCADILSALYFDQLRYRVDDVRWPERDRFLLSAGHYAIGLYAALVEAGMIPESEMETYGADDSRLPMNGMAPYTPGMEITGGSLGHGLGLAVGMCLGLRLRKTRSRVFVFVSDGEIDEGSTWEAVMSASHFKLDNLIAIIDVNNQQADGPSKQILSFEPLVSKFEAFGWFARRVDGNNVEELLNALDAASRDAERRPRVVVCDTLLGKGVPFLEMREKAHFMRVEPAEWELALRQLEQREAER
jgi:transketolase